jgi:hypothetical protein
VTCSTVYPRTVNTLHGDTCLAEISRSAMSASVKVKPSRRRIVTNPRGNEVARTATFLSNTQLLFSGAADDLDVQRKLEGFPNSFQLEQATFGCHDCFVAGRQLDSVFTRQVCVTAMSFYCIDCGYECQSSAGSCQTVGMTPAPGTPFYQDPQVRLANCTHCFSASLTAVTLIITLIPSPLRPQSHYQLALENFVLRNGSTRPTCCCSRSSLKLTAWMVSPMAQP